MTKPLLFIKLVGFWDKDDIIFPHYFQTSHSFLFEKYDIHLADELHVPDVYFCSIFGQAEDYSFVSAAPKIMLIHEDRKVAPSSFFDSFNYVISFTNCPEQKNNIRIPYWVYRLYDHWYSFDGPFAEWFDHYMISRQIDDEAWNRTKFCGYVHSKQVAYRETTFDALKAYKPIDSGGTLKYNLTDPDEKEYMAEKLYGAAANKQKQEFFKKRRFSFCMENDYETVGYTTEKIIDSYAAGTIPIYAGQMMPSDNFNIKAFVNLYDFDLMATFVERVKYLDTNEAAFKAMINERLFTSLPEQFGIDSMTDLYTRMIERKL